MNLAKTVLEVDPVKEFVIIAQTQRCGGKTLTLFKVGNFYGSHLFLTRDGGKMNMSMQSQGDIIDVDLTETQANRTDF